jgi:hypothetical protein
MRRALAIASMSVVLALGAFAGSAAADRPRPSSDSWGPATWWPSGQDSAPRTVWESSREEGWSMR